MKKVLAISTVLLVLGVSVIWAQGQGEAKKDGIPVITVVSQPTSITSGVEAVLKAAEEGLGIKIDLEIVPGGAEGVNVIRSRIVANDMPDVFLFNTGSLMNSLDPEKNFVDLSGQSFIKKLDGEYLKAVSINDKVYGVPIRPANYGGIIYNKKVFAELGLEIPRTWEEFIKTAQKIKATGRTAVIGSLKSTWTSQLIVLADYYNVQKLDPAFTENYTYNKAKYATNFAAHRSFEKLADLSKYQLMNTDYLATSYDDGMRMIADGSGAMWPMLGQVLPVIAKNYPDLVNDLGMFPIPSDDASLNGLTVWMPNSFYVTKSAKNVDVIMKLLEFYISDAALNIFMQNQVLDGSFLVKNAPAPAELLPAVQDIITYQTAGNAGPALEFVSPVKGPALQQICVEVLTGNMDADKGAREADYDIEKQAVQLQLPGWVE